MEKSSLWEKTEVLLDDLTNYPIKYSLKNLKSMANEISKGLGKKIKLTLRAENLLDQDYTDVGGFSVEGRNVYAGFVYNFN